MSRMEYQSVHITIHGTSSGCITWFITNYNLGNLGKKMLNRRSVVGSRAGSLAGTDALPLVVVRVVVEALEFAYPRDESVKNPLKKR